MSRQSSAGPGSGTDRGSAPVTGKCCVRGKRPAIGQCVGCQLLANLKFRQSHDFKGKMVRSFTIQPATAVSI